MQSSPSPPPPSSLIYPHDTLTRCTIRHDPTITQVKESVDTASFYLGHADGSPVCSYLPGMYFFIHVHVCVHVFK